MTFRTRAEFEAEGGRLLPPFITLIAGGMNVVDLISTHNLTASDLVSLRAMVDQGLAHWRSGSERLRDAQGLRRSSTRVLDGKHTAWIERFLDAFLNGDEIFNNLACKRGLGTRDRRYVVWVIRQTVARFEAAKLALRNAALIGTKRVLPNTFELDPKKIEDQAERRRLARNCNYVRHLSGRRGFRGGTLMRRYCLTLSEALQIRDSANAWRRACVER